MNKVKVSGIGSFLPGEPVPFDELDAALGELSEAPEKIRRWVRKMRPVMKEMLGVEYFHYAFDPKTGEWFEDNVSMACKASEAALAHAGLGAADVDLIVYCSPYMHEMPSPSTRLQEALGIESCAELSIHSNCTSIYKGLLVASELIKNGSYDTVLVATANTPSASLRADYYNQSVVAKEDLFLRWYLCDGAGAVVLQPAEPQGDCLYLENTYMESVGGKKPAAMYMRHPSYYLPPNETFRRGNHHLAQAFQDELGKHFQEPDGTVFTKGLHRMLTKCGLSAQDVTYLQINMPTKHVVSLIMEECKELGLREEQIYTAISSVGYSGPPAAIVSLEGLIKDVGLNPGETVLSFVTEVSKFLQAGFTVRRAPA